MRQLNATQAARHFSELLDAVEQRGETYLVARRGRAVAQIAPAQAANGKALKEFLRTNPADSNWGRDLQEVRAALSVEERSWDG